MSAEDGEDEECDVQTIVGQSISCTRLLHAAIKMGSAYHPIPKTIYTQ